MRVYHLQLFDPQLFAALQRDPVLLGVLQSIIAHSCAQADHYIHPAEKKTVFYSYTPHSDQPRLVVDQHRRDTDPKDLNTTASPCASVLASGLGTGLRRVTG